MIGDIYGLQGMANSLTSYFQIVNNIDATVTQNWNSGAGFVPIGNATTAFTGGFVANTASTMYTINNLFINSPNTMDVGLFGNVNSANFAPQFLYLTNANVTGGSNTGILAGNVSTSGTAANLYVTGSVTSYAGTNVGWLDWLWKHELNEYR